MADEVKTYRGRSLEELLPQVREELGPDAVVLRRREGLVGGVGGFFQRRFVEIDARGPQDADPVVPAPPRDLRASAALAEALANGVPRGGDTAAAMEASASASLADALAGALSRDVEGLAAPTSSHSQPAPRNDRATVEGLASPAVRSLVEGARPFADALARAESGVAARAQDVLAAAARGALAEDPAAAPDLLGALGRAEPEALLPAEAPEPGAPAPPVGSGLYGPQRRVEPEPEDHMPPAPEPLVLEPEPEPEPALAPEAAPAFAPEPAAVAPAVAPDPEPGSAAAAPAFVPEPEPDPAAPAPAFAPPPPEPAPAAPAFPLVPASTARPPEADAVERALVASGLSGTLAADLVGEVLAHDLPFAPDAGLRALVRAALARRLPAPPPTGSTTGRRVLALVGAGGAGKSTLAEHVAAAYARAGHRVAVVALRAPDGGRGLAARVEPLGVSVLAATTPADVESQLALLRPALLLVDCPRLRPGDVEGVRALLAELRALGATEVHLALPATLSAPAAEEALAALHPLGITHVALTHADETARPGAPVERALRARRPLSFEATSGAAAPVAPQALAARLLP